MNKKKESKEYQVFKSIDLKYSREIYDEVADLNGTDGDSLDEIKHIMIQMTSDRMNCQNDTIENFYSIDDIKDRKFAHYVVGPNGVCKYLQSNDIAFLKNDPFKKGARDNVMVVELLWNNVKKGEEELIKFLSYFLFAWGEDSKILNRRTDIISKENNKNIDIFKSLYNKKSNWEGLLKAVDRNISKLNKIYEENKKIIEYNKKIDLQINKIIENDETKNTEEHKESTDKLKNKLKKTKPYDINFTFNYSKYPENQSQWELEKSKHGSGNIETKPIHELEDYRTADSLGGMINRFTGEAIRDSTKDMNEFEPIYPDLTVPPRGNSNIYAKQITNLDELFLDKKYTVGDIVNKNDPYPTEQKIAELQAHRPKVKIEEAEVESLGESKQWFLAMSERTEKRLVQLENITSTLMRYFNRLSSRIKINCVYYGGQATYYKYRCIRCMDDNLVMDRKLVTIDQCLNCSRYEPVEGQTYDILDDDLMLNLAPVLDDNQMSRMNIEELISNIRTDKTKDEIPKSKYDLADVNTPPEKRLEELDLLEKQEKYYEEEKYFNMDWRETPLEKNTPDINKYEYNPSKVLEDKYNRLDSPEVHGYEDIEKMEINIPADTYTIGGGTGSGLSNGGFASDIREKIVARAEELYKMCQNGEAQYSQAKRTVDGPPITYRDCSSLVNDCYKAAGLPGAAGSTTRTMYEYFKKHPDLVTKDENKAKPGDIVLFANSSGGHAGLYIGNGLMVDASKHNPSDPTKDINRRKVSVYGKWSGAKPFIGYCRTVELDQADKTTASFDNFSIKGLKEAVDKYGNRMDAWKSALQNMNKYGYKDILLEECKKGNFDPNLLMGIIARESNGDPNTTTPRYKGLCQIQYGPYGSDRNSMRENIKMGIEHFKRMKSLAESVFKMPNLNYMVALSSYNSGQGNLRKWLRAANSFENVNNLNAVEFVEAVALGYKKSGGLSGDIGNYTSRSTYGVMILYYAEMIKQSNIFSSYK